MPTKPDPAAAVSETPEKLSPETIRQALRQAPANALANELWTRPPKDFLGHDQHAPHISLAAMTTELERRSRWFSEQARRKAEPNRQAAAAATAKAAVQLRQALLALDLTAPDVDQQAK